MDMMINAAVSWVELRMDEQVSSVGIERGYICRLWLRCDDDGEWRWKWQHEYCGTG
jgi:hypothetical protein